MAKVAAASRAHGLARSLSGGGGIYQFIALAAVAAALIAVMTEPAGAQTYPGPNNNVRVDYLPNQQKVLITLTDGGWFGWTGHLTLVDKTDTSKNFKVDLDDDGFDQNIASKKISWSDHVKLASFDQPHAHLPLYWASYNGTVGPIDKGLNWLHVLTPRVTGATYQDTSDGKSQATVTVSENIRDTNVNKICIVNKATQDEIECAESVSKVSNRTATATFLNNRAPPSAAQLVISSGFVQSEELTRGYQWNMYTYAYDITYTGEPAPTVTGMSYVSHTGVATITASEAIQAANATNICVASISTGAAVECAESVSVSGSTVTANFLNNQSSPDGGAKLVAGAGAVQDAVGDWNAAESEIVIDYWGLGYVLPAIQNLKATPDHVAQSVKLSWDAVSSSLVDILGYHVEYWTSTTSSPNVPLLSIGSKPGLPPGASSTTVRTTTNSWTHSDPAVDTTYNYRVTVDVETAHTAPLASSVSATVMSLPTVSNATFDESTNTVTLTASQNLKAAKASNVCVHNTIQLSDGTYEPLDRCGSSATVSGATVTVTISGEYVNATMTSESVVIGTNAIQNTQDLWNGVAQEITLYP